MNGIFYEACMNAVNAVLSCKAGWGQYFMFLYTLKLLSMWSFTKGCQYGASQYFLIKEYSGRVLAGGKLRQFGLSLAFAVSLRKMSYKL